MNNKSDNAFFICIGCGKSSPLKPGARGKYCTLECYRRSHRPGRKTGKLISCAQCKKEKYVRKSELKKINFCSPECHNEHQGRRKVSFACKVCHSEFRVSASRLKFDNPTYCSIKCRNKCEIWRQNACVAANLKQQLKKGPNKLEVAGYSILDEIGVSYTPQSLVAKKFTVDAEVNELKLIIQWDGDYWHGYRKPGDCRPLDHRQKKRMALDLSQDAYMRKAGYTVIRFWEHEIYKEPNKVKQKIEGAIRKQRALLRDSVPHKDMDRIPEMIGTYWDQLNS